MNARLTAICVDAGKPRELARFWSAVLLREIGDDGVTLPADGPEQYSVRFTERAEPKAGPNRMHFDLSSAAPGDQERTVARALAAGARHIDVGQRPEEEHVVLADPEGNEFCVIEYGNDFLAGCGLIGALSCDGSREVGYFWSAVLGWPLVWDQDAETAIQSPSGGMKISWGGPPLPPKNGRGRVRLDIAGAGAERLVALGATRAGHLEMADPDGNEFQIC
ncbi:VOC family protein [Actinoplanes sp. NPDC051861]|uniref:VOC family protein n=1 Tax=Actinoplanes sp. NPDC051861 TaxID=3155170 RepID=UPI00341888C2